MVGNMSNRKEAELKRRRIREHITKYRLRRGFAPSVREMSRDLDIPMTTIYYHLRCMQESGVLTMGPPRMARTWAFVDTK